MKWKSSVYNIYRGNWLFVSCIVDKDTALKKKPYWSVGICVRNTWRASSVQVHLGKCSITLKWATPHTLPVCAEPSLFTGIELGSYVLHVMVCSSDIRRGNGTVSLCPVSATNKFCLLYACPVDSFQGWKSFTSNRSCSRPLINLTVFSEDLIVLIYPSVIIRPCVDSPEI